VLFVVQIASGICLLMCYRVTEDQFGYLCLLMMSALFNWVIGSVHSLVVNLLFILLRQCVILVMVRLESLLGLQEVCCCY
jgi:quinol-cytochrome oxidoreductase complex cytochrome b subunit